MAVKQSSLQSLRDYESPLRMRELLICLGPYPAATNRDVLEEESLSDHNYFVSEIKATTQRKGLFAKSSKQVGR